MNRMTRRQAMSVLVALPLGARMAAETRPGPRHRVILGNSEGMLLAPDRTLHMWVRQQGYDTAPSSLGLGHNGPMSSFVLATVPGLSNVVAAAAGWNCSFAVLGDGRLLAWGKNPNGLLGTTTQEQLETLASWSPNESNKPLPLSTRFDALDVSAGESHTLALARDGSVYAWGIGKVGQLGIGPMPVVKFRHRTPASMSFMPVPTRVPDLDNVIAISAGVTHSLALLKDGTVRAWGANLYGEIGDGTTTLRDRPIAVTGVRDAVAIAAGGMLSLALLTNGTVMAWGARDLSGKPGLMPTPLPGVRSIKAIAAGLAHGVALTDGGTVMTWGENAHSQLGRGRNAPGSPGVVKDLTGVQSIASRHETTVAVLSTGRIVTWGEVREFNRPAPGSGRSTYSPSPIPMSVDGLEYP